MKHRREMEHKTTQECRILNRAKFKVIGKHKRQRNTEIIRDIIDQNRSLEVLRKCTVKRREIQNIEDTNGNMMKKKQEIFNSIKIFYQELYRTKG